MNLFNLVAKVTLDTKDYDKGVKKATRSGKGLAASIGTGLKKAGAIGLKAVGVAVTGIATLTGFAVKNFAQYEQLVGGVETLFKGSADKVQKYAENAYKTAGMSANQYMETATGFAASLLQSLQGDTEKAADLTDLAMRDMSDNANKMGTSMESIRYAYQGFAKQNFMMLDNLKIGYGGTKTEMQRLLRDADKINAQQGKHTRYQIKNYSDIIEAIHVVQTEMGITGTTAQEAEETISGSFAAMKASFTNLITAFGRKDANVEGLTKTFVNNLKIVAKNVSAKLPTILKSVSITLKELIKSAIEELPNFISTTLPELLKGGLEIINGIIMGISQNSRAILQSAFETVKLFVRGLVQALPDLTEAVLDIIPIAIDEILEHTPEIVGMLVEGLFKILVKVVEKLPEILWEAIKAVFRFGKATVEKNKENWMKLFSGDGEAPEGEFADFYNSLTGEDVDVQTSVQTVGAGEKGGGSLRGVGSFGDVTINVNAAEGQSTSEIAREVAREFERMKNERSAVYG